MDVTLLYRVSPEDKSEALMLAPVLVSGCQNCGRMVVTVGANIGTGVDRCY